MRGCVNEIRGRAERAIEERKEERKGRKNLAWEMRG